MWLISERNLPIGVQFHGAGDWFCFHFKFVAYLVNSKDEYLSYLKNFYAYSIMAPEVFDRISFDWILMFYYLFVDILSYSAHKLAALQ